MYVCVCARVRPRARARVCVHKRAYTEKLHIQRWRPNGRPDQDPNWYKYSSYLSRRARSARPVRAARNRGGAAVPRKREAGEQARSARVHEWNMAAHVKTDM
jgi:predicted amidohydrolase YtcJ